jgi:hypothetical protein
MKAPVTQEVEVRPGSDASRETARADQARFISDAAMHTNFYLMGARESDFIAKCVGWTLGTTVPRAVLCQARQSDNNDRGFTDQFVIQVIETARDFIRIRIRRIDDGTSASGWGQNLRVDILVIE